MLLHRMVQNVNLLVYKNEFDARDWQRNAVTHMFGMK